jgi:hypothetical protein
LIVVARSLPATLHDQKMNVSIPTGIEGPDDVRMADSGGGLNFPLKTGDDVGVLHHAGGKDLDGRNPVDPAVLGLEHLPHAARPDFLQHDVIAEYERRPLALRNLLDLELRQFLLTDEFMSQFLGIPGIALGRQEFPKRLVSQKSTFFELLDELFQRNWHLCGPGPCDWSRRARWGNRMRGEPNNQQPALRIRSQFSRDGENTRETTHERFDGIPVTADRQIIRGRRRPVKKVAGSQDRLKAELRARAIVLGKQLHPTPP